MEQISLIKWHTGEVTVCDEEGEYTPEEMPDEIVDFLVGLLERWEARRVGL